MTPRRVSSAAVAAAILVNAIAWLVLYLANDRFLLSGGSDAPNLILGPPLAGQILGAALMACFSLILLVARRGAARRPDRRCRPVVGPVPEHFTSRRGGRSKR